MSSYLQRVRSALRVLLGGSDDAPPAHEDAAPRASTPQAPSEPAGENLAVVGGALAFVDAAKAAADPPSWLDALDAAVTRHVPFAESTRSLFAQLAARSALDALLPAASGTRLLALLRPRPGLGARLGDLQRAGILAALLPEAGPRGKKSGATSRTADGGPLAAIESLERLLSESSLTGERFGSMLREVRAPELLVLALLLGDAERSSGNPDDAVRRTQPALDRLALAPDDRRMVEFVVHHRPQMSLMAVRQDTGDPGVIGRFAEIFSTEEQLKMLCLATIADLGAMGPNTLTPWKAELLWRLFVDTYNHMTMSYGDEIIDSHETALTALNANRPHDISDAEMSRFIEGLPRRYLTLFDPDSIYQHVRMWRGLQPDDVHFFVSKKSDVWELSVVTLDKPYLFSNICGVLAYLDLDILRGYALTSRSAPVLDVFQFTDHKGCLALPQLDPLLSDAVAGRADITALLREKAHHLAAPAAARPPVIFFDNDASPRYTILELVADDAPGLLHRISRIISRHGCVVDLVLISTEGTRAIDVFHMRKGGLKLTDTDELALTEDFERMLSGASTES